MQGEKTGYIGMVTGALYNEANSGECAYFVFEKNLADIDQMKKMYIEGLSGCLKCRGCKSWNDFASELEDINWTPELDGRYLVVTDRQEIALSEFREGKFEKENVIMWKYNIPYLLLL